MNTHYTPLKFLLIGILFIAIGCKNNIEKPATNFGLQIAFSEKANNNLNETEKTEIKKIISQSEKGVRILLPDLPKDIQVNVTLIDRNIPDVGGITGRADAPGMVIIEISTVYPGGHMAAVHKALAATLYHEFHHLYRGWTIQGNKFGRGIPIAAVNEGLAVVFSKIHTQAFEANAYPENADEWLKEVLQLPTNANYGEWMFNHPDGREAIGYKVGHYLVEEAMEKSGLNILEMGKLSPKAILKMAQK